MLSEIAGKGTYIIRELTGSRRLTKRLAVGLE